MEKTFVLAVVYKHVVLELALRQSLMVIPTTDILLHAKYLSPLYTVPLLLFARKLIVRQHLNTQGHIGPSKCTYL